MFCNSSFIQKAFYIDISAGSVTFHSAVAERKRFLNCGERRKKELYLLACRVIRERFKVFLVDAPE